MSGFIFKRTLWAVVVVWAVATLVFFMLRIVPGDPIAAMLFDVGDPAAADELRIKAGLDQPVYVAYAKRFGRLPGRHLWNSHYGRRAGVSR